MKLTMVRVAAKSYSYDRKLRKDVRVSGSSHLGWGLVESAGDQEHA